MRLETDEYGYIYIIMPSGEKRYLIVVEDFGWHGITRQEADVPGCTHYGKLKLGEPITEECK